MIDTLLIVLASVYGLAVLGLWIVFLNADCSGMTLRWWDRIILAILAFLLALVMVPAIPGLWVMVLTIKCCSRRK